MTRRSVVVMPGDGIGKGALPEALRVLEAAGFEAEWISAGIGWEHWVDQGNPLPEATVELIAEHKVALFGAITSKPKDKAAAEIRDDLKDLKAPKDSSDLPPLAECGPILEVVQELGPQFSAQVRELMESPDRDQRYYATLCCNEMRHPENVSALADRLLGDSIGR